MHERDWPASWTSNTNVLQYHLYSLAVHRHLRTRLAGYDYARDFWRRPLPLPPWYGPQLSTRNRHLLRSPVAGASQRPRHADSPDMTTVDQLYEQGFLSPLDLHLARTLGRLGNEFREEVVVAVALLSRHVAAGNVCLDLDTVASVDIPDTRIDGDWTALLASSPLVDDGKGAPTTPLVLNGTRLYMRRHLGGRVRPGRGPPRARTRDQPTRRCAHPCDARPAPAPRATRRRARRCTRLATGGGVPRAAAPTLRHHGWTGHREDDHRRHDRRTSDRPRHRHERHDRLASPCAPQPVRPPGA